MKNWKIIRSLIMVLSIIVILVIISVIIYYSRSTFVNKSFHPSEVSIHVINLDRSKDRLRVMQQQCQQHDITFNRFSAIDGHEWSKKDFDRTHLFSPRFVQSSKKGMLACTLSHLQLWKEIVHFQTTTPYFLILEDDVIFRPHFWKTFSQYFQQVPSNWDVIYLGGSNIYGKKISSHVLVPLHQGKKGLTNVGAYAYLIKKSTATQLQQLIPFDDDFDIKIKKDFFQNHKVYYFYPPLIVHNNTLNSERRISDGNSPKPSVQWRNKTQSSVTVI